MTSRTTAGPSRAAAAGLLVLTVGVGALSTWTLWPERAPTPLSPGATEAGAPGLPVTAGALGADGRARVPKFVTTPATTVPASDQADSEATSATEEAAGNDDLGPGERAEIDRWQTAVRDQAAAKVGLAARELAQVQAIRARLDARRAHFEAQLDPGTRMLEPLASAAVFGNARAELRQLERALGRDRAAALRDAETASYRHLLMTPGTSAATKRTLARRMLRSPSPGQRP